VTLLVIVGAVSIGVAVVGYKVVRHFTKPVYGNSDPE
jgi:hypothetical protein